jgi:hypothetical protein
MELKYQNMRDELVQYLKFLAKLNIGPGPKPAVGDPRWQVYNDVGYAMSFILDDINVTKDDGASCIGILIYDETEASAVAGAGHALLAYHDLCNDINSSQADLERNWLNVKDRSTEALIIMLRHP